MRKLYVRAGSVNPSVSDNPADLFVGLDFYEFEDKVVYPVRVFSEGLFRLYTGDNPYGSIFKCEMTDHRTYIVLDVELGRHGPDEVDRLKKREMFGFNSSRGFEDDRVPLYQRRTVDDQAALTGFFVGGIHFGLKGEKQVKKFLNDLVRLNDVSEVDRVSLGCDAKDSAAFYRTLLSGWEPKVKRKKIINLEDELRRRMSS